jgi:hypothetical protein
MPKKIELFCWVKGDELNRVFLAEVKQNAKVAQLKSVIQAEKPSFKDVDPEALKLWKFELGLPDLNDESANRIELEGPPLNPWLKISDLWVKQPPDGTLSVILLRPAGSECEWVVVLAVIILIDLLRHHVLGHNHSIFVYGGQALRWK